MAKGNLVRTPELTSLLTEPSATEYLMTTSGEQLGFMFDPKYGPIQQQNSSLKSDGSTGSLLSQYNRFHFLNHQYHFLQHLWFSLAVIHSSKDQAHPCLCLQDLIPGRENTAVVFSWGECHFMKKWQHLGQILKNVHFLASANHVCWSKWCSFSQC